MGARSSIYMWKKIGKVFFIFNLVCLILISASFFAGYFESKKQIRTIEMNNKVYATAVFVGADVRGRTVLYQFTDVDGTEYNIYYGNYSTHGAAEERLGEQIEIYIDGKGHCALVGITPKPMRLLISSICLFGLALTELFIYIYLKRRAKRKKPN